MRAILHWSDGIEEGREIDDAHRESIYIRVARTRASPSETILVRAGLSVDGVPIFYADDSLRPTPFSFECEYTGPRHS